MGSGKTCADYWVNYVYGESWVYCTTKTSGSGCAVDRSTVYDACPGDAAQSESFRFSNNDARENAAREKVSAAALAMAAAEAEALGAGEGTLIRGSSRLAEGAKNMEQKKKSESKMRHGDATAKRRARRDAHRSNTVAAFMQSKAALESRGRTCEKCGMGDNLLPTCCGKGGSWHGLCSSKSNAEYTWLAGYDLCNGDHRSQVTVPMKHMLDGDDMRFTPTNESNASTMANATQVAESTKWTRWTKSATDANVAANATSGTVNPDGTLPANSTFFNSTQKVAVEVNQSDAAADKTMAEADRVVIAEKMKADAEAEAARVYKETMKAADEELAQEIAADDEEAAETLAADNQDVSRVMAEDEREAAEAEKKMNVDAQEGAKAVAAASHDAQKRINDADQVVAKAASGGGKVPF